MAGDFREAAAQWMIMAAFIFVSDEHALYQGHTPDASRRSRRSRRAHFSRACHWLLITLIIAASLHSKTC